MSKIFILRLNSLISSKDSTLRFGNDNEIVIPMVVWNELKNYKDVPEKRRIAKEVEIYLESLDSAKLFGRGVKQSNGSILRVAKRPFSDSNVKGRLGYISERDREIFETCKEIQTENPDKEVILISKNSATRTEARSLGINAQDFENDLFPTVPNQYSGRVRIKLSEEGRIFLKEYGKSLMKEYGFIDKDFLKEFIEDYEEIEWIQNMFVEIETYGYDDLMLGRIDKGSIVELEFQNQYPYGIIPKNIGQKFLLESLMTSWEKAPLVIAKGSAGTGKTYCSLAYALARYAMDDKTRILIATPAETVGNEQLGFLPGDIQDKFAPHLGGFMDNITALLNTGKKKRNADEYFDEVQELFDRKVIELQPIGFLRGRTIENAIFIIDETQNVEPGDIKSIVTRAAEGSKFIFLGDPTQVDNPKLNERYNGLVYLSERMKGNNLCWQVTLDSSESVRSELSTVASRLL